MYPRRPSPTLLTLNTTNATGFRGAVYHHKGGVGGAHMRKGDGGSSGLKDNENVAGGAWGRAGDAGELQVTTWRGEERSLTL